MTSRTSSFITAMVSVWSLAVSALAQTNLTIRMEAIRIASDGALHLDLVLSDAMLFVVEHSTNLVNWKPFWNVLPGGVVSDPGDFSGVMGGLAGPLELRYSTLPSGSVHFFRCRIVSAMRPVPQQSSMVSWLCRDGQSKRVLILDSPSLLAFRGRYANSPIPHRGQSMVSCLFIGSGPPLPSANTRSRKVIVFSLEQIPQPSAIAFPSPFSESAIVISIDEMNGWFSPTRLRNFSGTMESDDNSMR